MKNAAQRVQRGVTDGFITKIADSGDDAGQRIGGQLSITLRWRPTQHRGVFRAGAGVSLTWRRRRRRCR